MQLRVKNLMQEQNNEDLYKPINLNHIFNDDGILDEWIREGDEPILSWVIWLKGSKYPPPPICKYNPPVNKQKS